MNSPRFAHALRPSVAATLAAFRMLAARGIRAASTAQIAAASGYSVRQTHRAIEELEALGMISRGAGRPFEPTAFTVAPAPAPADNGTYAAANGTSDNADNPLHAA